MDEDWLCRIFEGANCDVNTAINHVLDTPENHMVRKAGARTGFSYHGSQYGNNARGRRDTPMPRPAPGKARVSYRGGRVSNSNPVNLNSPIFKDFCATAKSIAGNDLDENWLAEVYFAAGMNTEV